MIAIPLEGMLRSNTGSPIRDGVRLYRLLTTQARVTILTEGDKDSAWRWLREQTMLTHAEVMGDEQALGDMDLRVRQVEVLRATTPEPIVFEVNPERALLLMGQGVCVSLFAPGKFIKPADRLDRAKARSWADISNELESRQALQFSLFE